MNNLKQFVVLLALLFSPAFTSPRAVAAGAAPVGAILVDVDPAARLNVTVTIYYEAKPVMTKDIATDQGGGRGGGKGWTTFGGLPFGAYEVHCEAAGYTTVIRQTIVRQEVDPVRVAVNLEKGQGAVTFGPGPSLQELEARIKKLEEARK